MKIDVNERTQVVGEARLIQRATTIEIDDKLLYGVGFDALVKATRSQVLDLSASSEFYEEITGQQLLEALESFGAKCDYVQDPETGEILEITASVGISLEAGTVSPAKLLGDLAQTSVGLSGAETQVVGLAEWTISWKRKTADATTTDDDTYESSLGSTASWSVKAKYIFIDGDPSQQMYVLNTITSPQSPQTWNFFPTIATGRAAFQGNAYVDGIDIKAGMGMVCGLDVSLKGTGRLNFLSQVAPVANANTGTGQQAEV